MQKGITEKQKEQMRARYKAGESAEAIAKDFDLSGSTVNYHIHKDGHVTKAKKSGGFYTSKHSDDTKAAMKKVYKKRPKFIDMPVAPSGSDRVAIVITDKGSLAAVLGGLWK